MSKRIVNATLSAAIVAALYAAPSYAQERAASTATELDQVVVTGSYIRGTPEDSALPVDVVTAEDLEEQGSPTVVQFVKTITAATSSIGEANRHLGGAGTAQVNLRGLGASRTLTLFNNRRLADNAILVGGLQAGGANLNFIPQAAIGRVEVLKDGAAATYGSDAVAGVVNFITRTDLDGVEVAGQYAAISDSDGDYEASIAWGNKLESGNILVTFGYRHRSPLDIRDRDWALQPFENAAWGGWTGAGNPGMYVANVATSATTDNFFRDNGCNELGGFLQGPTCRFRFSNFVDLVNEEDHYQFHAEFNSKVGDNVNAHAEVTWARDWVPEQRISPSNTTAAFPTSRTSDSLQSPAFINGGIRYNVPAYAPGLQELIARCAVEPVGFQNTNNCASLAAAGNLANPLAGGVDASATGWRAIAHAGHPTNADKSDHQSVENKAIRFSAGLNGDISTVHWDTAITYMTSRADASTNDLLVNRIQEGLNGYLSIPGSADPCSSTDRAALEALGNNRNATNHNSLGCYFFNPFSNSVAVSAVNGQPNPFYRGDANPAVINDPRVVESMYGNYINTTTSNLGVFDVVFTGTTGIKLFGSDEMGWAAGAQYRHSQDKAEYGDNFNNQKVPCVDSIDGGIPSPSCTTPNGPLVFFGSGRDFDVTRGVYAAFAEISLPIFDSLNASLAGRFEQYPGSVGSTFDPKLQVKYQMLDWLAFRGSFGSTFRAPNPTTVGDTCNTGVANINGTYRAVQTCSNPDLEPEKAKTYNVGILLSPGNFTFSADYYLYQFEDELINENPARMHSQAVAGGCASPAALLARFQLGGPCTTASLANPTLMRSYYINGPDTDTSGIDVRLQYDWTSLSAGLDATYIIEYDRGDTYLKDSPTTLIAPGEDRAGHHDLTSSFYSYPEVKGNVFVSYRLSDLTFRLQTRYSKGTTGSPGLGIPTDVPLDDYWQHDLIARWAAPWGMTVTASVQNVLDTDPPDAPSFYNYDYLTGNVLGRVFELGVKQKF